MKAWWANVVDALRSSYWFVPTVMAVAAALLAWSMILVDVALDGRGRSVLGWLHAGDVDAARHLFSLILGVMITVLTVVFSITIVALGLASSQFGPRMLRTFMQDRGTQVVMGTFMATMVYCLAVLGVIGHLQQVHVIPHFGALGALALTVASVGMLIFFVDHIARSIQSFEVVAAVSRELHGAIDRMFPDPVRDEENPPDAPSAPPDDDAARVSSPRDDYIQSIDFDTLTRLAERHDLTLEVIHRAGEFLIRGDTMLLARPAAAVDEACLAGLQGAFILGNRRNPTQDVEFSIRQLVEIGVRALSPGINDPFTAVNCIDRLGAALAHLAGRDMSDPYHIRGNGPIRVHADRSTFSGVVDTAFDQLRQHGRNDAAVTIRMLDILQRVGPHTCLASQREALRRQAQMIHRGAQQFLSEEEDRRVAADRFRQAMEALSD